MGKSYLVERFGKACFDNVVAVDFERHPGLADLFESRSPEEIVAVLEVRLRGSITPGKTLLFLDEIQAAPSAFASLRYFHEEMPELHVIAAGSLLEIVLGDAAVSVPVGRIEFLHLGPMLFDEFLQAVGEERLGRLLAETAPGAPLDPALHEQATKRLKQYLAIGGMPAVVQAFLDRGSYRECHEVQQALITTIQDDFAKYKGRLDPARLRAVFARIPRLVGSKFKFANVDREARARDLKPALEALVHARVAHRVPHTSCSGVPLGATESDRHFKVLFMDVGLFSASSGLNLADLVQAEDILRVNAGAVCEQFVGQQLIGTLPEYIPPNLHYWMREARTSSAEVDYVIADGTRIFPIEVKAGKAGTLRSIHQFLRAKNGTVAVRLNADPPTIAESEIELPGHGKMSFALLSLPLYMASQVRRLCSEWDRGVE